MQPTAWSSIIFLSDFLLHFTMYFEDYAAHHLTEVDHQYVGKCSKQNGLGVSID